MICLVPKPKFFVYCIQHNKKNFTEKDLLKEKFFYLPYTKEKNFLQKKTF